MAQIILMVRLCFLTLSLMVLPLLASPVLASAAVDVESLSTGELHARYQTLIAELRCPKCQNQNLADSDSPISADLRREIRRMLEAGDSDAAIKDYLVARYGDYILYRPQLQQNTYLLWLGPGLLLIIAGLLFFFIVRRHRQPGQGAVGLSPQDSAELEHLLARLDANADAPVENDSRKNRGA